MQDAAIKREENPREADPIVLGANGSSPFLYVSSGIDCRAHF
jgi:hypothetical protein